MLIIGPSGSGKTNTLLHLIDKFHPIDKIYLYAKDTDEDKYQYLINKREQVGIKNLNDPHTFIEYSNDIKDVLGDINNYNKNRDKKGLIIFDDMIADIMRSKKFIAIVKELFIRCRKLNISIFFYNAILFYTFNTGLDETAQGCQEEGITKLLKDIRDSLAGNAIIPQDHQDLMIMEMMIMEMMIMEMMIMETMIVEMMIMEMIMRVLLIYHG